MQRMAWIAAQGVTFALVVALGGLFAPARSPRSTHDPLRRPAIADPARRRSHRRRARGARGPGGGGQRGARWHPAGGECRLEQIASVLPRDADRSAGPGLGHPHRSVAARRGLERPPAGRGRRRPGRLHPLWPDGAGPAGAVTPPRAPTPATWGPTSTSCPATATSCWNFAYRSTHELAKAAKSVIAAHYGRPAQWAYYNACSGGGPARPDQRPALSGRL